MVEHVPTEKFFVGASIAVSDFVRPISLYNRITNLKGSLVAAIMQFPYSCPPSKLDLHNWRFSYARKSQTSATRYDSLTSELPCQNCRTLLTNEFSGKGGPTVLGACAEYCAVNELLPEEQIFRQSQYFLSNAQLERNYKRCDTLLKSFRDMSEMCITALETGDRDEMERVYWNVINFIHIFGLRPECNRYF